MLREPSTRFPKGLREVLREKGGAMRSKPKNLCGKLLGVLGGIKTS